MQLIYVTFKKRKSCKIASPRGFDSQSQRPSCSQASVLALPFLDSRFFFSTGNFFAPSSNCRNFKWLLLYCTPSFFKTTLCSMNRVHCPLSPANFDKRLCSCFVYYNDYHIVVYTSKERSGANKKIAKTHVELWLMT